MQNVDSAINYFQHIMLGYVAGMGHRSRACGGVPPNQGMWGCAPKPGHVGVCPQTRACGGVPPNQGMWGCAPKPGHVGVCPQTRACGGVPPNESA